MGSMTRGGRWRSGRLLVVALLAVWGVGALVGGALPAGAPADQAAGSELESVVGHRAAVTVLAARAPRSGDELASESVDDAPSADRAVPTVGFAATPLRATGPAPGRAPPNGR
ncbi:MAG TPA: hypothetical protein PKY13_02045 [Microthrixaceae bacterium]|nr:hypothetical protein [Microthrixaceae bacterium]